jgi:hypothetical protein
MKEQGTENVKKSLFTSEMYWYNQVHFMALSYPETYRNYKYVEDFFDNSGT